ncbi:MAG: hypothetical protein ACPGUV_04975 [Polyangiales bacterium]
MGLPHRAAATMMQALDLRTLLHEADVVARVRVLRQRARWQQGRILTTVTLRVDEMLFGPDPAPAQLSLRLLGGRVADTVMRIAGEPRVQQGATMLLVARRRPHGHFRPVGMSQGLMPITRTSTGLQVCPGARGVALVQRDAAGKLHSARPALTACVSWAQLRPRLRQLLQPASIPPKAPLVHVDEERSPPAHPPQGDNARETR